MILLETRTGLLVNIERPHPDTISIFDIAHSLARQSRFIGHAVHRTAYSVAQHSVWVADRVKRLGGDENTQALALLDDAHEAYIGHIAKPIKLLLQYTSKGCEIRMQETIREALGIQPPTESQSRMIAQANAEALAVEARLLTSSGGHNWRLQHFEPGLLVTVEDPWPPSEADERFLNKWYELSAITEAGSH